MEVLSLVGLLSIVAQLYAARLRSASKPAQQAVVSGHAPQHG